MKSYMKAWRKANLLDRKVKRAAYNLAHKKERVEYRNSNKDRINECKRIWYKNNREKVLSQTKARSLLRREKILAYQARYYSENTDKVRANVRVYQQANPDKKRHLINKRRARKAGNGGSHTLLELKEKFASFGDVCFYCGCGGELTVDHDIPLSRGGTDDIDNILPACRSCNSRKNSLTAVEFFASRRFKLVKKSAPTSA